MSNQHATYKVFFGFQRAVRTKRPWEDMMKSNAPIGVKERFRTLWGFALLRL